MQTHALLTPPARRWRAITGKGFPIILEEIRPEEPDDIVWNNSFSWKAAVTKLFALTLCLLIRYCPRNRC